MKIFTAIVLALCTVLLILFIVAVVQRIKLDAGACRALKECENSPEELDRLVGTLCDDKGYRAFSKRSKN